jgi:ABC-type Fe3+/spermidine/putrescine transport system ATPase subunit
MIEIRALTKVYNGVPVLREIDLTVRSEERVVLLGPSGGGKTTLLRLIAGLERVDAGSIRIGGREVSRPDLHVAPRCRALGMVFQDLALWPHMKGIDIVRFALKSDPVSGASAQARAMATLAALGIDDLAHRQPYQLSGGQRQRLALARALAPNHALLLLDEPFNNLDTAIKTSIMSSLVKLQELKRCAILHVTHQLDEALALADRILLLSRGRIADELHAASIKSMSLEDLTRWYLHVVNG